MQRRMMEAKTRKDRMREEMSRPGYDPIRDPSIQAGIANIVRAIDPSPRTACAAASACSAPWWGGRCWTIARGTPLRRSTSVRSHADEARDLYRQVRRAYRNNVIAAIDSVMREIGAI
jgi:hypothetical protein